MVVVIVVVGVGFVSGEFEEGNGSRGRMRWTYLPNALRLLYLCLFVFFDISWMTSWTENDIIDVEVQVG
jgi:hypothetical protein